MSAVFIFSFAFRGGKVLDKLVSSHKRIITTTPALFVGRTAVIQGWIFHFSTAERKV